MHSPLVYLHFCQCLNCFILYCYDTELLCFMHSIQDWSSVSKRMHGPYLISNHCTSPHYCICKFLFYITLLNYIVFPYWTYHIALIVFPLFTNMLIVTMKNSFSSVINDFYLWFTCSGRSAEEHCIYSFFINDYSEVMQHWCITSRTLTIILLECLIYTSKLTVKCFFVPFYICFVSSHTGNH